MVVDRPRRKDALADVVRSVEFTGETGGVARRGDIAARKEEHFFSRVGVGIE